MNKMKHYLPSYVLKILYNSLISPHLNFGILAWGFSHHKLEKLQKRAVRIIVNAKYNSHTEPIFKSLGILKIKHIFERNCLKFYYKVVNGTTPSFFLNMFVPNAATHNYNTRQRSSIRQSTTRIALTENCMRHFIPKLVKETPTCITDKVYTHSLEGFSNYIKAFNINRYISTCNIQHCYICNR